MGCVCVDVCEYTRVGLSPCTLRAPQNKINKTNKQNKKKKIEK